MGVLKKAVDNFEGISNSIESIFETRRSIENNNNLRKIANGDGGTMQGANAELQALQQIIARQQDWHVRSKQDLKRRILNDPELKKQIQEKRAEILEKTGKAVSIDDIIDIYFDEVLDEDGLTPKEAKKVTRLQKQYEEKDGFTKDEAKDLAMIQQGYEDNEGLTPEEAREAALLQKQYVDGGEEEFDDETTERKSEQKQKSNQKQEHQDKQSAEESSDHRLSVIKDALIIIFIVLLMILIIVIR